MFSRIVEELYELLFPRSGDERRLARESVRTFINHYRLTRVEMNVYALSQFEVPSVRAAIHLNKFHENEQALVLLSALVKRYLEETTDTRTLLIPIPLGPRRLRERKHNQVTRVLKKACESAHGDHNLLTDVLIRTKDTPPQTSLSRAERKENLKSAFSLLPHASALLPGSTIVLFDDVTTTGTTFAEAVSVLKRAKPKSILCIAFAH